MFINPRLCFPQQYHTIDPIRSTSSSRPLRPSTWRGLHQYVLLTSPGRNRRISPPQSLNGSSCAEWYEYRLHPYRAQCLMCRNSFAKDLYMKFFLPPFRPFTHSLLIGDSQDEQCVFFTEKVPKALWRCRCFALSCSLRKADPNRRGEDCARRDFRGRPGQSQRRPDLRGIVTLIASALSVCLDRLRVALRPCGQPRGGRRQHHTP